MSDPAVFSLLLLLLLTLLASGVWVAVSLLIVALAGLTFFSNAPTGLVMATTLWGHSHSWPLAALPLFILMGEILLRSRLSNDMFTGLAPWLGRAPGRLLHVNVLGCAIFAAVSGSSAATAATIGRMSVPELTKRGYPESLILGTLAGSATLGFLIPPSVILIVYGVATEQSIARLFIAGILPGLMLVLLFGGYVALRAWMNPALIPAEDRHFSFGEKLRASKNLLPVVLLIGGVIGTIYTGVASPTDAAAVGVLFSIILAVATGSFTRRDFIEALMSAMRTSAMIAIAAKVTENASSWPRPMPSSGRGAPSSLRPSSTPSRVSSAPPPIQVWMPYQPQATTARATAGTLAPITPKEARASTA